MIHIHDLSYRLGGKMILDGLTCQIKSGEFIGVLGKNGAGKTTFLDLLLGLRRPIRGQLTLFGSAPWGGNRTLLHKVSYLSQDIRLKDTLSIEQFLKFHSHFYPSFDWSRVHKASERLELSLSMKIGELSTGQRKQVQVISGYAVNPSLYLIDEITAVLDPHTRGKFFDLMQEEHALGKTVLLATNIADDLVGIAQRVLFIRDGLMFEHTPTEISELFGIRRRAK